MERHFEDTSFRCGLNKPLTQEDEATNSDVVGARKKPKSNHYETYIKIHNLNLCFGLVVGLKATSTWKYNNATRWTKFMLIFGTVITIYSHLLVITQPTKLIEVFSLFSVIAPVSL